MNTLHLIVEPTRMSGPRHGGAREERHATLYVNMQAFEHYAEGRADTQHSTGAYYDDHIRRRIEKFEAALNCKCIRGRMKGVDKG